MSERTSSVDAFDRGRIRRVIRFGETTVGEAMIPISEVTAISHTSTILRVIATVRRKGYNRLPVYKGNISNITGIVTLTTWDLLDKAVTDKNLEETDRAGPLCLAISDHRPATTNLAPARRPYRRGGG